MNDERAGAGRLDRLYSSKDANSRIFRAEISPCGFSVHPCCYNRLYIIFDLLETETISVKSSLLLGDLEIQEE